jgi:hypothetical protein
VRSAGGVNDYLGSMPGIPELCRMTRADGTAEFYYGAWRSDWPGAGQAYPAIRAVVNGGTGARASFVTRSYPGRRGSKQAVYGLNQKWPEPRQPRGSTFRV